MTDSERERRVALLDLLAVDDPTWSTGGHGPFVEPRGRRLDERSKRDLAVAYAAWRRQEHAGELEHGIARKLRMWRRA